MSLFSEALHTDQQKEKRMQEKQVDKTGADVPVQHFYLTKTAIMSISVNNRRDSDRGEWKLLTRETQWLNKQEVWQEMR